MEGQRANRHRTCTYHRDSVAVFVEFVLFFGRISGSERGLSSSSSIRSATEEADLCFFSSAASVEFCCTSFGECVEVHSLSVVC